MKHLCHFCLILFSLPITAISQSCVPEGITFTTQAQIDSFQVNYPGCTEIQGDVTIGINIGGGSNITDLNGLSVIHSIGGSLYIYHNYDLPNLDGMEGVTSIGGTLWIGYSQHLTNLDGLENVTSVGGDLYITYNILLNNLIGLESLTSIGGTLWIWQNPALTSLTGLENINAGSISDLSINWNISLSTCDVQSICDFLVSPNGTIEIHDNSTGCDSQEEVEAACGVGIAENLDGEECVIFPNPSNEHFTIGFTLDHFTPVSLEVMNRFGQVVEVIMNRNMPQGEHQIPWNADGLSSGIYFYRFTTDNQSSTGKLVIAR